MALLWDAMRKMSSLMVAAVVGGVAFVALSAQEREYEPSCKNCPGTYIPNSEIEAYVSRAKANQLIDQQVRQVPPGVEVAAACLLGEVEVPEHPVADPYRHPEERRHRRVVVGEPVRSRVLADVVQPQRLGMVDEQAQHAVPARQVTDLRDQLLGDAVVDEGPEPTVAGLRQHAQSGVLRVDELTGDGDDPL